jgi:hypothetical protein
MKLGTLETERLLRHARRLDLDKCEIVRGALYDRLNALDEREAFELAQKTARKSNGVAKMGSLPGGQGSVGLPIRFAPTAPTPPNDTPPPDELTPNQRIANKLARSFRRYCEFVEGAEGAVDRSIRITTVLDDLKERGPLADAEIAFAKFQEQLKAREELQTKPIERLPDDVAIFGDTD